MNDDEFIDTDNDGIPDYIGWFALSVQVWQNNEDYLYSDIPYQRN